MAAAGRAFPPGCIISPRGIAAKLTRFLDFGPRDTIGTRRWKVDGDIE
jgi:hypothetical protein